MQRNQATGATQRDLEDNYMIYCLKCTQFGQLSAGKIQIYNAPNSISAGARPRLPSWI